jgi:hypothetical protein
MGDVVEFPLRVLHLRPTSVVHWWEASFGRTVPATTRFGGPLQTPRPERTPKAVLCFGREHPEGWLRCRDRGLGPYLGFEEAPVPRLRLGFRRSSLRRCSRVRRHS